MGLLKDVQVQPCVGKSFSALVAKTTPRSTQASRFTLAAFTLTELLVVIAILALLAATQLPALNRAKAPVKFTQCMNNLRQIGQATLLYKDDNNDCFPYGSRIYMGDVQNPYGWPMQLLRYLGGYKTNVQPEAYICPSVMEIPNPSYAFQVHYQANRLLLRDSDSADQPILGSQVRSPAIYWMFIEKGPGAFCNITSGGLANPVLLYWNYQPGSPEFRRHNGGMTSATADGHVEWLRTPPYLADSKTIPLNFLELGDCSSGNNPPTTWQDTTIPGDENGGRAKLWSRYARDSSGHSSF
jgi:prepilin-type N-terminal cleavage/methylation domain-containing protein/prepilin-type processing-associated H-X9-DG protein